MGANAISTTVQDEAARRSCQGTSGGEDLLSRTRAFWNRETFIGSAILNLLAFAPPAVYSTLSQLWVAKLSSSEVVTTDVYTYIGIIVEVLNDGIPRSAWLIIGDKSSRSLHTRLNLAWTMIIVGVAQGLLMTIIFLATSTKLAAAFVPAEVRHASLAYVRWSSIQGLTSATEAAISSSTRALDKPEVPLIISASKFLINIVLDFLLISTFRVGKFTPTIVTQAIIRLICDTLSVIVGLLYFVCVVARRKKRDADDHEQFKISLSALATLVRPSVYTLSESVIRNTIYLWLVNRIVQLGYLYATAWGIFTTIRWGLVMLPVQALESSTLAFVGHNWGHFRAIRQIEYPRASRKEVLAIIRPAILSCGIILVFETAMCIALSISGIHSFALYLSGSNDVASVTQKMWKAIDWTYIFYGLNYQLGAVLLAASPRWYLYQALGSNLCWMLPWAIVVTVLSLPSSQAWTYYAIIFGGALVFDFLDVGVTLLVWIYRLSRQKIRVGSHV